MNKAIFKKEGEELQSYLSFKKHGFVVPAKKGRGSYNRKKSKRVEFYED